MVRAVIFDIDGTLIDSLEANLAFFQEIMRRAGYPLPTVEQFRPLFHKPTREVLPLLSGVEDAVEIERMMAIARDPSVKTKPPVLLDGAAETISILSRQYPLAVATSRMKMYAYEPPLNKLEKYFSATVAYEDTKEHKPYPAPLLLAAERLEVSPNECVYIGDAETDSGAARAAGMQFICYAKDNDGLPGARHVVRDLRAIPDLLKRM